MLGPDEYLPDATEGITNPEDLPQPKIKKRTQNFKKRPCPCCGYSSRRHDLRTRFLHHLGDPCSGRPVDIELVYSVHYCCKCQKYFSANTERIADPHSHYTHEVVELAVRIVVEDGLPYCEASWHLWRDHRVFVPFSTIQKWVEASGEKNRSKIESKEYFDWASENFSGYIAVDELYDGPFCVLSLVDNREYKRLTYRVVDHDPTHDDIRELFRSFQGILKKRKLTLCGITTDGSHLYPEPIAEIFPDVRHQLCEFHVKKPPFQYYGNKSVLKVVTQVRRELEKTKTKRSKRGRPTSKEDKQIIRKNNRIKEKIAALFENRYLFVQKVLTPKERETLHDITKGLPELRKLREIVDEVYRLYDRRCRTQTALEKLRKLRMRIKRFKELSKSLAKLDSPTLEKSLEFLDDKLLPSTSNAVERGNRRHRKMQKTVYRVRTRRHIENRIALDMFRDLRLNERQMTTFSLQLERSG